MNCMRCGVEIDAEQVFCLDCQAEMAKYPVDPNTVIQLPRPKAAPVMKKPTHRRILTPEEQVKGLKKLVRGLALGWLITAVLLGVLAFYLFSRLADEEVLPGQNYSSVSETKPNVSHETSVPTVGE